MKFIKWPQRGLAHIRFATISGKKDTPHTLLEGGDYRTLQRLIGYQINWTT